MGQRVADSRYAYGHCEGALDRRVRPGQLYSGLILLERRRCRRHTAWRARVTAVRMKGLVEQRAAAWGGVAEKRVREGKTRGQEDGWTRGRGRGGLELSGRRRRFRKTKLKEKNLRAERGQGGWEGSVEYNGR
eukprot:6093320-Pleurochrysis_carterae.AAC.1